MPADWWNVENKLHIQNWKAIMTWGEDEMAYGTDPTQYCTVLSRFTDCPNYMNSVSNWLDSYPRFWCLKYTLADFFVWIVVADIHV